VDLQALVDIAAETPNLECYGWDFSDNEERYVMLRLTNRRNFASALSTYAFPALKNAETTFCHERPSNQNAKPANLLGDHSDHPLSAALLRTFS
jgi:hypothetical protein